MFKAAHCRSVGERNVMKVLKSKRVITLALAVVMMVSVFALSASANTTPAYTQSNYWFWDDPSSSTPLVVPTPMGDDAITAYDYDEDNLYIYTRMMEYRGVDGYFSSFKWGVDPLKPDEKVERMVFSDSNTGIGLVKIPLADLVNVTAPFFLYPVDVQITLSSGDHIPLPDLYFWIQYIPPASPAPAA
jgi:hypothetical protein